MYTSTFLMDTKKQQQAMASVIAQLQAKFKDLDSQRAAGRGEETRLPAPINPSATDPIHDPLVTDSDSGKFGNTRSGIPDSTPMKTPADLEAELVRSRIRESIAIEASRAEEARQKDKSAHDAKYSHVVNELVARLPDYPL